MKRKPVIAISAGEVVNTVETWASVVYGQSTTYSEAVIHAGGVPVIMPITDDAAVLRHMYELCDGLLLAGGNDVDPARYGQKQAPETLVISPRRDAQELQLLQWALDDDMPVLAICRGMQLLNVSQGGSLHQHIPVHLPHAQNHEASRQHKNTKYLAHSLRIDPASRLANILEVTTIAANSQHHQAVHKIGTGLVASAWAEDEIVEALELPGKQFVLGVQPHPEGLEAATEVRWAKLFDAFIGATKH